MYGARVTEFMPPEDHGLFQLRSKPLPAVVTMMIEEMRRGDLALADSTVVALPMLIEDPYVVEQGRPFYKFVDMVDDVLDIWMSDIKAFDYMATTDEWRWRRLPSCMVLWEDVETSTGDFYGSYDDAVTCFGTTVYSSGTACTLISGLQLQTPETSAVDYGIQLLKGAYRQRAPETGNQEEGPQEPRGQGQSPQLPHQSPQLPHQSQTLLPLLRSPVPNLQAMIDEEGCASCLNAILPGLPKMQPLNFKAMRGLLDLPEVEKMESCVQEYQEGLSETEEQTTNGVMGDGNARLRQRKDRSIFFETKFLSFEVSDARKQNTGLELASSRVLNSLNMNSGFPEYNSSGHVIDCQGIHVTARLESIKDGRDPSDSVHDPKSSTTLFLDQKDLNMRQRRCDDIGLDLLTNPERQRKPKTGDHQEGGVGRIYPISIYNNFIKISNSNTNLQTQSSNALHNAIMEAGSKDRPLMLAPVPVTKGSSETTTERYMENYKNVSQDIRDQLNAEAEAVQIILTGIDNDIYSTVDACPNACEMWKAIERLKQEWQRFVTLVKQSQELKTVSYHKLYDILKQHQNEVNEIRAERLARTANPLALSTRNRGKAIVTSYAPTYDPEPATVTKDEEMSKEKEIDKLMALISLSFKKIYKPTNNNLRTSSNTSRANQDNSPRINRGTRYDNQRAVNVAGARENVEEVGSVECRTLMIGRMIDGELMIMKWKLHYMYMQTSEVNPDPVDNTGTQFFDDEPTHMDDRMKSDALGSRRVLLRLKISQSKASLLTHNVSNDFSKQSPALILPQNRSIPYTSVSQTHNLRANHLEDRVMSNNCQGKKQEVEGPPVNSKTRTNYGCACFLVEIILFIVDSGCSKHMTGNLKLLTNFVEKFLGTVKFGNDQIAPILGYGDLVQGAIMIKRVYYVEGLNHNLFSVGQFCDADFEVPFRKSTVNIRVLKGK
ncbi:hypothetical protein Tco_0856783 [Tanacetum coccineum]|uniref:Retrovirus-related Pol polyprotein from transposon TNT 1-94-like beta-barrel domain-containing protein n=1 Tax=Tanacetum coccineum TaxID=301880 RepID=A0ABQ5B4A6_9ASTR